jgi:hypothetical protein
VTSFKRWDGIRIRLNIGPSYGGGRGGGGGGQFGRDVVRRLAGGDRSSDGFDEDDELDSGCCSVV